MPLSDFDLASLDTAKVGAVVVCEPSYLQTFTYSKGRLKPMTYQKGLNEENLTFKASEAAFLGKCIPQVLEKTLSSEARIAIVNRGWSANIVGLVEKFIKGEENQPPTGHNSVSFCIFDASNSVLERVAGDMNWHPKQAPPSPSTQGLTKHESPPPSDPVKRNQDDDSNVDFVLVSDIPAMFGKIVWHCTTIPAVSNILVNELFGQIKQFDGCFSTEELAKSLCQPFEASLNDIVWAFDNLRHFEGRYLFIPMIKFDSRHLSTRSLLANLAQDYSMRVSYEEYDAALESRIFYSDAIARNNGSIISNACLRCLRFSTSGLKFLDLCEDIVHELTGELNFCLSLADTLYIYNEIKDLINTGQK